MTSRCKRDNNHVTYRTKTAATRAVRKLQNIRTADEDLTPYPCTVRGGQWHIGHGGAPAEVPLSLNPAAKWSPVQWEAATLALWARCRDLCEWCSTPLRGDLARHHRQRKAVGGDRLANLVALHTSCHRHVHAHPEEARARGFIVSAYADDPALVPVQLLDGSMWLLDDAGKRIPAPHRRIA